MTNTVFRSRYVITGGMMAEWKYKCPCCKKTVHTRSGYNDVNSYRIAGTLFRCPICLNVLEINDDLTVSDFKKTLIDNRKKRKAESKLNDKDVVCVMDIFQE